MTAPAQYSITELPKQLHDAREEIGAQILMALDSSGNLVELSSDDTYMGLHSLAALAAANLAATQEMSRLGRVSASPHGLQTLIVEGEHGCLTVSGGAAGLIFVAVLAPDRPIGIARLELRRLAEAAWVGGDAGGLPEAMPDLEQQMLKAFQSGA